MKTFTDYINSQLEITHRSFFKSEYDLKADEELLLSFKCTSIWGTLYEIEGLGKCWELYKPSVWKNRTDLREKGFELPIAYIESSCWKNKTVIHLPRGEQVNLKFNVWKSTYELHSEKEEKIAMFKNKSFFSSTIQVSLFGKIELIEKYPFVLFMAFYVALQNRSHAAIVS